VLRATYAVAQTPVGAAARATGAAIRSATGPIAEAGEAVGTRLGGPFARNAARQAAARQAANEAVADAARPTRTGVRASTAGEIEGQSAQASTRSGPYRPNATTPDNRGSIVTPNGEVPPPNVPPPPLNPLPVRGNNGETWVRNHCAEIKLFGYTINSTTPQATGRVAIGAGAPTCPSCTANAWNFRLARPGIDLQLGPPGVPTAGAGGALAPGLLPPPDPARDVPPPILQWQVDF
jgi:hypothetical protein